MSHILKIISVISFLLLLSMVAYGQQTPHHTQYVYHTQLFNPAYVGSKDYLSLTFSSRLQWIGIDGAPETHTMSIHNKIKEKSIGLGVSFILDRIGPIEQKHINIDASYTIDPSKETKLAFGLKLGGEILTINLSRGHIQNGSDPLIEPLNSKFTPKLGAGAFWYSKYWYLGFSVMNLLHTKHFDGEVTDRPHYFLLGGYVFEMNKKVKFKPAILTKIVGGAPISINISANLMVNKKTTVGLSYNNGQSLSAVISTELNSVFSIGYSYDYSLKSLNQFNDGSHEIVLMYRFTKSHKGHRCVARFF